MPETIAGIPLHPLIVHVPVVFIPLTLLAALATAVWRSHRRVLSLVTAGTALVGMLGAQLATMSGESLQERLRRSALIAQHADLGEAARTISILVFLVAAAVAIVEWRDHAALRRLAALRPVLARPVLSLALIGLLVVSSAAATTWVVRAGHMGAKAAWSGAASPGRDTAGRLPTP